MTCKGLTFLRSVELVLKEEITASLDIFLIGTVAKSPSMTGHGLTTKVKGKTVSLYVRKRHRKEGTGDDQAVQKVWLLVQKLSKVNWEILKMDNE